MPIGMGHPDGAPGSLFPEWGEETCKTEISLRKG